MRAILLALAAASLLAAAPPVADAPGAARAEKEAWTASLEVPARLRPGEPARAAVRIQGRAGYHVNRDYPTSFTPDPAAAATLGPKKLPLTQRLSAAPCPGEAGQDCEVALALPFTPPASGPAVVAGTLAFSVCSADRCLIEKARLAAPVPAG